MQSIPDGCSIGNTLHFKGKFFRFLFDGRLCCYRPIKYAAKWGAQIVGMNFQTRSRDGAV